MRNAFAAELTALALQDPAIVLLSGDMGNRLFNTFKEKFPERFFNCGVAEANMTGMAAGMALSGLRPITYTIAPFNTVRCLEQIRVDICYHHLPVTIVGVGAGLSYSELGGTHHACEDIALLRALSNMTVICPGDAVEVKLALGAALKHSGPVYLRIGKKNEPVVHEKTPEFAIGKAILLWEGTDVAIIATGTVLPLAAMARQLLWEKYRVSARVVSMHTVKPLDEEMLEGCFDQYQTLVTVEEHSLVGGLGGALSEWYVDNVDEKRTICRIGINDAFLHGCGKQQEARARVGLTPSGIADRIWAALAQGS